jgi:polysaccharide biosynthesis transport protein
MPADAPVEGRPAGGLSAAVGELDLRALGAALWRKKWKVLAPTAVAAGIALLIVQFVTPRYVSEARILIEGRENIFLRPEAEKQGPERSALDPEAVTSQVQLILSRDLARNVIHQLKLGERPEFDSLLRGVSPLKVLLGVLGLAKDPLRMSAEERVLEAYYERLNVFPVEKSRVIAISFQSADPELAARTANAIAEGYLALQQAAKQEQARSASQWLAGEIETLRRSVAEAEAKVEQFRAKSNLFVGANNTTLSNQQLGEVNSQVAAARAQKADAEARARFIRDMLRSGKAIETSDILNSEQIRRLFDQRAAVRAQLAEQYSTLLDAHPRIKELRAQIADLDRQMRSEAELLARSLENDARIASARVETLSAGLEQLKRQAAATNEQDVHLRALERDAKSQRDLLESYLAKYREATARDSINTAPADARIISRATVSNIPAYPKKLPIALIAALAMLALTSGFVVTQELLDPGSARYADFPPETARAAKGGLLDRIWRGARAQRTMPVVQQAAGLSFNALAELASNMRAAGEGARSLAVVGAMPDAATTLAAITLARALAASARVVIIDLAAGRAELAAISGDPGAPGLSELARGMASFGQIITKDRFSTVHLITAGADFDPATLLAAPRLQMTFDALARAYDHVVVDAGAAPDNVLTRLAKLAPRAVLLANALTSDATAAARTRLLAAGFSDVSVLVGTREEWSSVAGQRSQAA